MQAASTAASVINDYSPLISLATSSYGAYNTYKAGQLAERQSSLEAKAVEDAAKQSELEHKRALIASLSAQSAIAASRGITTGGSYGAFQQRDIKNAENDLLRLSATSQAKQRAIRAQGRATYTVERAKAAGQLFGGLQNYADTKIPKGP